MNDAPRRVYVVCAEAPPEVFGGLGRYLERMIGALAPGGTTVDVFAMASAGPRTVPRGAVTLHRIRSLGAGRDARPLARVVGVLAYNVVAATRILGRRRAGSVVAVHDWMGCLAGILCRLLGRRTVVFHVHTREIRTGGRSLVAAGIAALETTQAKLASRIVVPSTGMRDELVAHGWPADRLRVVPHGFDDPDLLRLTGSVPERDEIRRRHLPDGDGWLVVFAGRLSPHKGVLTLIRAVPRLVEEARKLRVVLVGAPSPRTDDGRVVADLIAGLGLESIVEVTGFRPPAEVYAHFLAADVCVFPSTYEPFGLVAVEAMALGRPVVVGPGYSPDVVGDGAVRCPDDTPDALAAALLRRLTDPAAADRLAARGAAYARARTWAATATATLATYAEVVR